MILKDISIEDIDIECEEFRISEEWDSPSVLDSMRAIGQMNPVVLLDRAPRKIIVCGFRRIRAALKLDKSQVFARILCEKDFGSIRPLELALRDNLSHRQLNPLEKARVLYKLQNACCIPMDRILKVYLPLLDLPSHESVLAGYVLLNEVGSGLRQCLVAGTLTLSSIEMLAKASHTVQNSFASLMTRIRLSASLQRKVLGLLEDLSAMAEGPLDAPLDNPQVRDLLEDAQLSPFQKGEKLHEVLYRIRNPRLSLAKERFLEQKRRLALPGSIRITPHPFFETADIRVEFDVSNAERFREFATALNRAAHLPDLEGLFGIH
jgi:hypothetical protein